MRAALAYQVPTTTTLYRPRHRERSGGSVARRTMLRFGSFSNREDRGFDRGTEGGLLHFDRHSQHAASFAVSDYTAFMFLGHLIEMGETATIFTNHA